MVVVTSSLHLRWLHYHIHKLDRGRIAELVSFNDVDRSSLECNSCEVGVDISTVCYISMFERREGSQINRCDIYPTWQLPALSVHRLGYPYSSGIPHRCFRCVADENTDLVPTRLCHYVLYMD